MALRLNTIRTTFQRIMRVDIETYAETDLTEVGVYKYVEDPAFEVLLFGHRYGTWNADTGQYDNEKPDCIDVTLFRKGELPKAIVADLQDPLILKVAWNAGFEIECLSAWLGIQLDPAQWRDTMVDALMRGLPAQLKACGEVLEMPQHLLKRAHGRQLVTYFCMPCKPTKTNGGRRRNLPQHDPEKWVLFVDYCTQDVVSEQAIADILLEFPTDEREWTRWADDIKINRRGVRIDRQLVEHAVAANEMLEAENLAELARITGLDNPNSLPQLKDWISGTDGELITSITKDNLPDLIKNAKTDDVRRALEIRAETGKSSVDKYKKALRCVCRDGRVRGLLQFYGANRTGREAGRLVQVQNMEKNTWEDLALARELLLEGRVDDLKFLFGPLQKALGQLVRTMIVPADNHVFAVVDEKSIEARVLAWLAQEQWRLDVFNTHGYLYEASASQTFGVPWSEFQACIDQKRKHPLRPKGKVTELALGFQGAAGAMIRMGAEKEGIPVEELDGIVRRWRKANPRISNFEKDEYGNPQAPGFWVRIEKAAVECVRSGRNTSLEVGPPACGAKISFQLITRGGHRALYCWLPGGRALVYWNPKLREGQWGRDVLCYEGYLKNGSWGVLDTYGGKLTENVTQAIARDVLFYVLDRTCDTHFVVFHVHDELVCEIYALPVIGQEDVVEPEDTLRELEKMMGTPIEWAPGLPLGGDGELMTFYQKGD